MIWADLIAELLSDIIAIVKAETDKDRFARLIIMQRRISDSIAKGMQ